MLSTTANSKVKTPRSSDTRDVLEPAENGPDNTADDKVRGYIGSYDGSSSFGGPHRDGRFRSRGRVTEFRHSRGSGRGRGGFPPRGDRDNPEGIYKYNESLAANSHDGWSQGNSKFFERSDLAVNLPEDPRISKLLRRLCAEMDVEQSLAICSKLQDAVMLPENDRYICRAYDILVESLLDVFYSAPSPETKESAAVVLGRIGYVLGSEFHNHLRWIESTYAVNNTTIKHLLTLSLCETFRLDSHTHYLAQFADVILNKIQGTIEGTDSADVFMAAINAMILLSNTYPEQFANHFVDTVDILVGWHVDNTQPKKIKDFALQALYKLSRHWQADVGFSVNLLNQFVEDMVAYCNDMDTKEEKETDIDSHEDCIQKITSFLNVFNTVVKSLGSLLNPVMSQAVSWSFLVETTAKVLQVLTETMDSDTDYELILAGNDCLTLLLKCLQSKSTPCLPAIFSLMSMQMANYLTLDKSACLSVINLISTIIREISSNLPIEFIIQTIGPDSPLRPLRYSETPEILKAVISTYSNLLNLKNIPLLQETYKYVLTDIQNAYSVIITEVEIISPDYIEEVNSSDAERNVIFYLQCLSELANASNSIIGMWALKPSILELLAIKMCPYNPQLIRAKPALQYSVLYLLYSHCKKNNHFIASSDLVTNTQHRAKDIFGLGEVTGTSPTSGHLAVILNTLSNMLDDEVPKETLLLVLNWISDIFSQLDKYLPIVSLSKGFLVLITNMMALAHSFDEEVVISVLRNCQNLVQNKNLTCNIIVYSTLANLCILHIDNQNRVLSKLCKEILSELPWDIVQLELDKQGITVFTSRKMSLNILTSDTKANSFKEYLMKGSFAPLSNHHFKSMMNCLLQMICDDKNLFTDAFLTTWPLIAQDADEANLLFFRQCAATFLSISIGWALSELAQSCVSLKLRTVLGKPQETFMKIEGALKGIARETSSLETKYVSIELQGLIEMILREQARSRWITEFLIFLEKYIYNAAEGTATVLSPVSKPVKNFFHTNWPTCREWLNRVRPAALAVSIFAGHYGAAVYHAFLILQTASLATTNIDIEAIVMSLSRALIKMQEPEVLHGLYIWIKKTFGKKFYWLKGAAEQANSRFDIAIEFNKKLLVANQAETESSNENDHTEVRSKKFINEHIIESYKHIQNWDDMIQWTESTTQTLQNTPPDLITTLKAFDENLVMPNQLSNWDVLDFESKEISKNSCSYQGILSKIECTLFHAALNIYHTNISENYSEVLHQCETLLGSCMEELSRTNSVRFLKEISILQLANNGLIHVLKEGKAASNPFKPSAAKDHKYVTDFKNLTKVLWWNQYFTKLNITEENVFYTECLRLDVIKSARKNSNFSVVKSELLKHFRNNSAFQMSVGNVAEIEEISNILTMTPNTCDLDIWTMNNAAALSELCKFTYCKEDAKSRAINLCSSVSLGLSQRLAMGEQSYELRERGTRLLLTLSKWVQSENENILENDSPLLKLVSALPEIGLVDNNISENVIPVTDTAVGKLLQFGVNQCPGLAKAWANFAGWCFRWGRKMVEFSSKTKEQLTDNEKLQIESIMIGCSPKDFEAVCEILSKTKATCDDEDIDWNEINTSEMIESQLRTVPSLSNAFPEHLALLVDIWRQAQKRVFSYFELSADAYFKFLQLICASDYINHSGENAVVNATLRLLRLIVKHAMELQTVLESGLANTPTQPWKVIIPQLFSRLNHPETYVRKCVSDLLCRLAEDTPHLITFPAVVGAVENETNELRELSAVNKSLISSDDESGKDSYDFDDNLNERIVNNELNSCFLDMVNTLSNQAPETILQVKLLVKELQRINLLWDEFCLGTLAQHHSEFSKRLIQLENEITKVKNNENLTDEDKTGLIKEKHRIIFEPVVFVLEQLYQITSAKPETPHEIAFQGKFLSLLKEVIDKLKNPENPEKPQESWAPLKQLQIKLQQKVHKRTSYILKMTDISPVLAEMKDTVITMPGVHTNQRAVRVTLKSIENYVTILPTKTRPKKLIFKGSDGKSYTYLFKGLEDLHLDERIMQLLSITNTMLARDSENNENQTYRARHYSVIPLGPRSGLISWVDNVTPLFALYKRWQNREAALHSAKTNKTVNVLRPSELFYNKLNPLLKEAGISTENRKDWPVPILKQVLQELSAETPKDLLWRELWCGSVSPEQWWQMTRRYSYSVAVMSTIGYIIGLGDRHLDNVLVDLTTGEVVHIDYNVCFEKGKTLRVPEKVPFRMTPNLVTALGVTGVEGIFRLACEHVIRTMRRGRETLLTLLEAFVYDPLVEWGGGAPGPRRGRSARQLRAAHAMLAVRVKEMRHEINEATDKYLKLLPEVKQSAEKWLTEHNKLQTTEAKLQDCHQQMAIVKEIEAYGPNLSSHPLYAISQKYASYKQAKNAVEDSMKAIVKIVHDFDVQIENFEATTEALNGPQFMAWVQEFSGPNEEEDVPIFEHIKEFLTNAGQGTMLTQCEQAEAELNQCLHQTTALIRSCLELLSQYVTISQYYPHSKTDHHRIVVFRKCLATALESKSPEVCREMVKQVEALVNADQHTPEETQLIVAYNYRLQAISAEATAALNKSIERLQLEGGTDALSLAQEAYREAKSNVNNWVRSEEGASAALESVVIGMLCNLNRRYLMLENGAQSAGDCLVDLTSRDGEWFLDDMYALSMQAVELLSLLPLQTISPEDAALSVAVECVRNANLLLGDLVQLNYNYSTIILPELLMKVHSEDPSMLMMISELNAVILNSPVPLNDILSQLEMHFRYLVMDMESPASGAQILAAELRMRYEALLSPTTDGEGQSPGRMLLMGFNGLFAAVELRARELADHLAAPIPPAWRKIDHINESMHMSAALQSPVLRSVLEDIFLIRRIQTLAEAAAMCTHAAASFTRTHLPLPPDHRAFAKPVRRFTAEYVSRCALGVSSRALAHALCVLLRRSGLDLRAEVEQKEIGASWSVSLESLCEKAAGGRARGAAAAAAGRAAGAAARAAGAARALRQLAAARAAAHAARARSAAHTHLHAEVLGVNGDVWWSLWRRARELSAAAARLHAAHATAQGKIAAVHQRVKWGAGANPALLPALQALESSWSTASRAASGAAAAAAALLQHARTAASAGSGKRDGTCVVALAHWEKACTLSQKYMLNLSAAQESLLELLHPDPTLDQHWVDNVSAVLSDMISTLCARAAASRAARRRLQPAAARAAAATQQHREAADHWGVLAPLMETMTHANEGNNPASEYLHRSARVAAALDTIASIQHATVDSDGDRSEGADCQLSDVTVTAVIEAVDVAMKELPAMRDMLFEMPDAWSRVTRQTTVGKGATKHAGAQSAGGGNAGGGGAGGGGRSAVGAGVWRRVRLKLEGRERAQRLAPHEQVEYIISEATSLDNLCMMYEGWMSWV